MEVFTYSHILTASAASELISIFNASGLPVVLDTETTGLDRHTDTIISFQLCQAGSRTAHYVDGKFASLLSTLTTPLILHNFKFDYMMLALHAGCQCDLRQNRPWMRDTMLMHHLLDENKEHGLNAIVQEKWKDPYKEEFWGRNVDFQSAPHAEQLEYACKDVIYTGMLYLDLQSQLELIDIPESLIEHVHALALALYDTELRGVNVDLDYLTTIGEKLKTRILDARVLLRSSAPDAVEAVEYALWSSQITKATTKLKTDKGREKALGRITKPEFNWDSGQQLQALIYGELGIEPVMVRDKIKRVDRPTLDDAALEKIADQHPLCERLRDYRGDQKIYGSFIEGTLERQVGGVIYPSFSVNGTVTGRISHSSPNLGQLPAEGGIRGIYVPSPGHKLVGADYGMLEVVIAAHFSRDANLLKIIYEGVSKHDITANGLGVERKVAKTLNFAIGYGCTEYKVAKILGCSSNEAKGALAKYWETYAGEKHVIDECQKCVDDGVPVTTLYGRQRHFPKTFEKAYEKQRAYRQAYNAKIQGTGSDVTHESFVAFASLMRERKWGRALLEVHDQSLGEALEGHAHDALAELCRLMVGVGPRIGLSVPLTADPQGPMERWED